MRSTRARHPADVYIELKRAAEIVVFVGPYVRIHFVIVISDEGTIIMSHFNFRRLCVKITPVESFQVEVEKSVFQIATTHETLPDCRNYRLRCRFRIRAGTRLRLRLGVRINPVRGYYYRFVVAPLLNVNFGERGHGCVAC